MSMQDIRCKFHDGDGIFLYKCKYGMHLQYLIRHDHVGTISLIRSADEKLKMIFFSNLMNNADTRFRSIGIRNTKSASSCTSF